MQCEFKKIAEQWDRQLTSLYNLRCQDKQRWCMSNNFKIVAVLTVSFLIILGCFVFVPKGNAVSFYNNILGVIDLIFLGLAVFCMRNFSEETSFKMLMAIPVEELNKEFRATIREHGFLGTDKRFILKNFLKARRKETLRQESQVGKLAGFVVPIITCFASYLLGRDSLKSIDEDLLVMLLLGTIFVVLETYIISRMLQNIIELLDLKYLRLSITIEYLDEVDATDGCVASGIPYIPHSPMVAMPAPV